jgi:hypothetical protein
MFVLFAGEAVCHILQLHLIAGSNQQRKGKLITAVSHYC